MSTSRKIFKSLKENSKNDCVANFLTDLFKEENKGLHQWNDKYDELIDTYYRGYVDED
ncbi:hypothetical protein [uncultured Methanobrevibacter sp.]|uniref:hypothetical protein n=1 Tax=uncultured Methanobrevibacter sp. TaxID=253161 RepID=UPI0025E57EB4|nr:hypothetical protein [uncultured Methanobrevibacter sp.]